MKNIYEYVPLLKELAIYYTKKYKISYRESLSLCIEVLIACLMLEDQFVKNHFTGYYFTKIDKLLKEKKKIRVLEDLDDFQEIEVIVDYLYRKMHMSKYLISDILGLDGYSLDNILDSIDLKRIL